MTVGTLVKKRRQELNITQAQLAKMLGYTNPQYISNLERGVCGFPRKKLKRLCRALMIDQSTLYSVLIAEKSKQLAKDIGLGA